MVLWTSLATACLDGRVSRPEEDLVRPNILWITVEDMSPHLGSYGDSVATTPHLDAFAREGVRYAHAFATAPVCSPARTALITGMYQTSIGAHQHRTTEDSELLEHRPYHAVPSPNVKAFPEYLRAAGYYCTNNSKTDYQFGTPLTIWDESGNTAHWRNRPNPEQPFFAVFNSTRTHESQVWPNEDETPMLDPARVVLPPYYPDTPLIREQYARMYDNIARMDEWAGAILAELEADGLADNTIVFFFSDHGDGVPRGKRWLQDSGIRVPLIIRWPDGRDAGTVEDRLVSFVDFGPTVLSLAGIPIPEYMQGQAFLGRQAEPPREYVFAARDRMDEGHDMRRAVRDKRYKYIKNYYPNRPYLVTNEYRDRMPLMQELWRLHRAGQLQGPPAWLFRTDKPREELYDVQQDPDEINNLAENPDYAAVLERMELALNRWQETTGDMGEIPETELAEQMWPGGVQPTTAVPVIEPVDSARVTITVPTEGASIAYTTSGGQWLLYTGPLRLASGDTLRARAVRYGFKESDEAVYVAN